VLCPSRATWGESVVNAVRGPKSCSRSSTTHIYILTVLKLRGNAGNVVSPLFSKGERSSGNMLDCGVRGPRFESHRGQLHAYRKHHYDKLYSLGHGLCTLTAVSRSTQPSTLRGMVKWVSAFELSNNNKWRWWVWFLAAYRRTPSPGRLAWSECRRPLGTVPHLSYEPGELSQ